MRSRQSFNASPSPAKARSIAFRAKASASPSSNNCAIRVAVLREPCGPEQLKMVLEPGGLEAVARQLQEALVIRAQGITVLGGGRHPVFRTAMLKA